MSIIVRRVLVPVHEVTARGKTARFQIEVRADTTVDDRNRDAGIAPAPCPRLRNLHRRQHRGQDLAVCTQQSTALGIPDAFRAGQRAQSRVGLIRSHLDRYRLQPHNRPRAQHGIAEHPDHGGRVSAGT
ncbi:hypothetical protein Adi01nite_46330 [Amorphoplanes digitatis]|nr:hypothetical protein Adi01nite_46330 [Actinoplanes digitatis]